MKKQTLIQCCALAVCLLSAVGRAETFQNLLKKHKQTSARFSIYAVDAGKGTVLNRVNSTALRIPASNMKLVASAAAVHYLGGDYTYRTIAAMLGRDLVVIGSGDPLLADPKQAASAAQAAEQVMLRIAAALKEAGISDIDNIVIDTSVFDNIRVHPSWPADQLNQAYACEVSGLNFSVNCVRITATRSGHSALLDMEPRNRYVNLTNQLQLVTGSDSAIGAYRTSTPNKLMVRGRLNKAAGFDVAIENPAGLFASVLCDSLRTAGITVRGQLLQKYVKADPSLKPLTVIETPLKTVIKRCNTESLNLAAECLIKTISAEHTAGKLNGEWTHGLQLAADYLRSLGIGDEQFVLDDGSGLSRNNRLTCETLVAVLKDMYKSPHAQMFLDSLAVGGVDGTAARFFNEAPYKGNILGKTGYIAGVRSFSGVCRTPRGDILFSILTEGGNSTTRTCINDITREIFDGTLR
jgi:D-alanyl-D-alanine carboxypeptidase/D-alanyl-D-alanine-endopeptidase (penicillin-binding protein 4)